MDKLQTGMAVVLAAAFMVSAKPAEAADISARGPALNVDYGAPRAPVPEDGSRNANAQNNAVLASRRYEMPEPPVRKIRPGRPW